MASLFPFEILTPEQVFYSGSISSLVAPQMEGYFGVLAHHVPLIARSGGGKLKIREASGEEHLFQIGPGIIEVSKNRAVVLTRKVETIPGETKQAPSIG